MAAAVFTDFHWRQALQQLPDEVVAGRRSLELEVDETARRVRVGTRESSQDLRLERRENRQPKT